MTSSIRFRTADTIAVTVWLFDENFRELAAGVGVMHRVRPDCFQGSLDLCAFDYGTVANGAFVVSGLIVATCSVKAGDLRLGSLRLKPGFGVRLSDITFTPHRLNAPETPLPLSAGPRGVVRGLARRILRRFVSFF